MRITDKSIYIPDIEITNPKKETIQIYDFNEIDKEWSEFHLNNSWNTSIKVISNFLKKFPEATSEKIINYHLQRIFKYAKRKNVCLSNCYPYTGRENSTAENEMCNIIGIKINNSHPFINNLYPINLKIESYFRGKIISQATTQVLYDSYIESLMLYDIKFIEVENYKIYQYNFEPEKIKKKEMAILKQKREDSN